MKNEKFKKQNNDRMNEWKLSLKGKKEMNQSLVIVTYFLYFNMIFLIKFSWTC